MKEEEVSRVLLISLFSKAKKERPEICKRLFLIFLSYFAIKAKIFLYLTSTSQLPYHMFVWKFSVKKEMNNWQQRDFQDPSTSFVTSFFNVSIFRAEDFVPGSAVLNFTVFLHKIEEPLPEGYQFMWVDETPESEEEVFEAIDEDEDGLLTLSEVSSGYKIQCFLSIKLPDVSQRSKYIVGYRSFGSSGLPN